MMNKDFGGFLSYSDKLSVALNATMSGGLLWISGEHCRILHAHLGKIP